MKRTAAVRNFAAWVLLLANEDGFSSAISTFRHDLYLPLEGSEAVLVDALLDRPQPPVGQLERLVRALPPPRAQHMFAQLWLLRYVALAREYSALQRGFFVRKPGRRDRFGFTSMLWEREIELRWGASVLEARLCVYSGSYEYSSPPRPHSAAAFLRRPGTRRWRKATSWLDLPDRSSAELGQDFRSLIGSAELLLLDVLVTAGRDYGQAEGADPATQRVVQQARRARLTADSESRLNAAQAAGNLAAA